MRVNSAEKQPEGRWIITRKSYKLIDDEGTFVGMYHLCPCCGFDKARGGDYCLNCGAKIKKGARYEMKGDRNEDSICKNTTMGNCEWYASDIRWTDKLSVTCDGDIIDFEGRVVGHINLMMGGAE